MTTNIQNTESAEKSRRSFMKTAAVATGALALGVGSDAAGARIQQDERAVLFSTNYFPGEQFNVVAQLEQGTTVDLLQIDEEMVPEISQPDEWNGHVIRYDMGTETAGVTTFLFLRDTALNSGDSAAFAPDASMFSPQLNLLETTTTAAESDAEEAEAEDETEAGTENETEAGTGNETEAETGNETDDVAADESPVQICDDDSDKDYCRD